MDFLEKKANAKINIGLDILRKRTDGYHEVKMIMQTINLADTLFFSKNKTGKATMASSDKTIPEDERNLIIKAANLFMETYQINEGVHIELEKRIPHAAGLGGGSADAAATFLALNEMFYVQAPMEELKKLGLKIGADVPFCMVGGTILAEGIGEKLTPLNPLPPCRILLVKPEIEVSTAKVYQAFNFNLITKHPDIQGMIEELKKENLKGIASRLENVLEAVTIKEYPVLKKYKEYMIKNGALGALMSGSGPTIFGIYENPIEAEKVAMYFRRLKGIASVEVT